MKTASSGLTRVLGFELAGLCFFATRCFGLLLAVASAATRIVSPGEELYEQAFTVRS